MLYGRTVRSPILILRELWTKQFPDTEVKITYPHVVDLKKKLDETCRLAHEQLKSSQFRQDKYYN